MKAKELLMGQSPMLVGLIHGKLLFFTVIQLELLLSPWLLVGGLPRLRSAAAIACFCLFACAASYEALTAMPSCGCFGNVKAPPAMTAGFDVLAVIALWLTRPRDDSRLLASPPGWRVAGGLVIAILLSGALWTSYFVKVRPAISASEIATTTKTGGALADDLVVFDPASWIGKPFPLSGDVDGAGGLANGRWLVVLYHYDCDSCRQAIPKYQALAGAKLTGGAKIAFIAMPPSAPAGQDPVSDSPMYLHLRLRPTHDWFATTPVVAALEDGKVIWAADGEDAINPSVVSRWDR